VKNGTARLAAAIGLRHRERTGEAGRGAGTSSATGRRLLVNLATAAAALILLPPLAAAPAHAQRLIQITGAKRTAVVSITVGKTEDIRIETAMTDVAVGDADIADVTPLTDHSLSILGKKIGTTRVTIYAEGKQLLGIIDVEVSYDVARLAEEIRTVAGNGIRVSSVNGRIMLSGSAPDAATLDKAVTIARQFLPDPNGVINSVQVLQPQQVMLEIMACTTAKKAN
jgi:pilus assembly protein CpaC